LIDSDLVQIREIFREELTPIRDDVLILNQTIFGPKGENGLYGDVKILKATVQTHSENWSGLKKQVAMVAGIVSTGITIAVTIGKQLLNKNN